MNTYPQVGDLVIAHLPNGASEQAIITMSMQGLSSAWRVRNVRGEGFFANFTPVTAPFSMIAHKDAIIAAANGTLFEPEAVVEHSSDCGDFSNQCEGCGREFSDKVKMCCGDYCECGRGEGHCGRCCPAHGTHPVASEWGDRGWDGDDEDRSVDSDPYDRDEYARF